MTNATDFRLYHSNALDLLAELLADALRKPVPGRGLLEPDVILIPQVAMKRWLQATLAQKYGIAANLLFLTPGEFVTQALIANVGSSQDELDAQTLQWRIYAALGDEALLQQPAMAKLQAYVASHDAAQRWALAGALANAFNKYSAWRRDWLLRWESGADADDPQAILWRAIASGRNHRARRIGEYLAKFADGKAQPSGLYARVFAFAILNVSPDVLRVVATQAQVGQLHFFLPTPSRAYWGDLRSLGARLHAGEDPFADADENPLLRDWGAAGKDFMALMGSYEAVHPTAEITAYADPAPTDKPVSLLRQMQSDVFHRKAVEQDNLRAEVDQADISLQFHACHTHLRELQVLHDRLLALLEDPRFDPPLQARDIAVLAPDIDAYVPYLEAVFGDSNEGGRLPYTTADTSPMQSESLAAVFLRLLALPTSRFGLEEVIELLASAPLAEAAGLEAADFERLRNWLHCAGARWGLDAAQRARSGAPYDAAFTWQFALDRLLLGMASGSEDEIAGVAPWPELEGSALNAVDCLLGRLRILAQYEWQFRQPMPPARWGEQLQALLNAVLPKTPAQRSDQRALERLRKTIVEFVAQADTAEFTQPIPHEVVHAYFVQMLNEADTRAPLLTGGVSFARMVPMRLLPFRVICLLGMNDGDFPRRDPAAGLNKLTDEIASGKRQYGDRSTRDDDRFLFLQLFSSAQDVFYLSWQGADPRSDEAREPSALVSELLTAAESYYQPVATAAPAIAKQLVLHHALQPFSPAAFGATDARAFSYRSYWHPAAQQRTQQRSELPAWMPQATPLAAIAQNSEVEAELNFARVQRFFKAPAEQFLRQRLALRIPEIEQAAEDIEPLQAPSHGLDKHALQHAVFDALLRGKPLNAVLAQLQASARLPSGALGRQVLEEIVGRVQPYADALSAWRGDAAAQSVSLQCTLDGVRIYGQLHEVYPHGVARTHIGKRSGNYALRVGLDWLFANACGYVLPWFEFYEDETAGIGPHQRTQQVSQAAAQAALKELLTLRQQGLQAPLLFAPYSSWVLFAADDVEKGVKDAAEKWRGNGYNSFAESSHDSFKLALRGQDPFNVTLLEEFARISGIVFGLVTEGIAKPMDVSGIAIPEAEDKEAAA